MRKVVYLLGIACGEFVLLAYIVALAILHGDGILRVNVNSIGEAPFELAMFIVLAIVSGIAAIDYARRKE